MLGDQILYFFNFFYYFLRYVQKSLFLDRKKTVILYLSKKISKKIVKNIKFGLQVHFNMEIMLSGSDRVFGL